jgi:Flp pilus assembly protein TadB
MILKLFCINFFILHPIIFIIIVLSTKLLLKLQISYQTSKENLKITKEIPALIDFLRSYLLAGLLLPAAFNTVLKQKNWCKPILHSLTSISNSYSQGKSFKQCLSEGIVSLNGKKLHQYLNLMLISLKLGHSTGDNMTQILEKIKYKTQDCIDLERKLKITTAQIRLQSSIIILSPLFLAIIIYFISPRSIFFKKNYENKLVCHAKTT